MWNAEWGMGNEMQQGKSIFVFVSRWLLKNRGW
jgi:hypothetical protein